MEGSRLPSVAARLWTGLPWALGSWLALWAALNAGSSPLADMNASDWFGWRALAPIVVAPLAVGLLLRSGESQVQPGHPMLLLSLYAAVALAATLAFTPDPRMGLYWAVAFAAPPLLLLATTAGDRGASQLRAMARLNWLLCGAFAAFFLTFAVERLDLLGMLERGEFLRLFAGRPETAGLLWITANGLGRFAAVLVVVGFAQILWARRRWHAPLWLPVIALGAVGLALTISRSALLGTGVALAVLVALRWGARAMLPMAVLAALAVATDLVLGQGFAGYFFRGESLELIGTFTGRSVVWFQSLGVLADSPLIGLGFHADRLLLDAHLHNAWFHALFQGGLLGLLFFAGAWLGGIAAFARLGLRNRFEGRADAAFLCEATAVLALLGVRSLVESTGAFFGVDLLLLAPLLAYAHVAYRAEARAARADAPAPAPGTRRVLVCAFGCAPPGSPGFSGGEDLLGWNLVQEIARRDEVWVLAPEEARASIEADLTAHPRPRLRFVYLDLPRPLHRLRRRQGGLQLYAYLWQARAAWAALDLHRRVGFDLFHHITYANDWMACHTGALLRVPYVRGPAGGAQQVPQAFARARGWRFRSVQAGRSVLQRLLRADPFFVLGQTRASALLLCCRESLEAVPRRWRWKAELFPVCGVRLADVPDPAPRRSGAAFTITSAGKLLDIKGFDLVLRAYAKAAPRLGPSRLVLVGDGPERAPLAALARALGVADSVEFTGWLPWRDGMARIASSDVFAFASLRDGGGSVVVEAMAAGVPCVVLDLGGPGVHVTEDCGVKIQARAPGQVIEDLAAAFVHLGRDDELRARLAKGAMQRAVTDYDWARLGDRLRAAHDATWAEAAPATARPRATATPPTFDVLGTRVGAVAMESALGFLRESVQRKSRVHVCVCSVNMVMLARRDPALRRALDQAALVVPDGVPLTLLGRRRGFAVGRVRGTDLLLATSAMAAREGYRCFFLGGGPGVADRVAAELQRRYPGLEVAGTFAPPFRHLDDAEDAALVDRINAARADLLWVGLGCPKQERWMLEHLGRVEVPVMLGVGAAFDFVAGTKREAPAAWRRAGVEWLWRFREEPRRLWRRVLLEGPAFVGLVIADGLRRRVRGARAEGGTMAPPDAGPQVGQGQR